MVTSFSVNHLRLRPGIYVSKVQPINEGTKLVTIDIRLFGHDDMENSGVSHKFGVMFSSADKKFIAERTTSEAFHTVEHYMADTLRSSIWADNIVYVGPMGCQTGFYWILKDDNNHFTTSDGRWTEEGIEWTKTWIKSVYENMNFHLEIPGGTPSQCGNAPLHSRAMGVYLLEDFVNNIDNLETEYPD